MFVEVEYGNATLLGLDGHVVLPMKDRSGGHVFAKNGGNTRELANVEKVSPPVHYHALLGETGPGHVRHREVVIFHGEYVYPEYLLGVQRIDAKGSVVS